MINRFEKFSFAVFNISKYWSKIAAEEMKKYGLKGPYAIYLAAMRNADGDITAAKLSELCGKDKADISRAVAAMEKQGLIKREAANQNLYRARLLLTETGNAAAEEISRRASLAVDIAGSGISDEDRAVFYDVLGTIANNLKDLSKTGLPQSEDIAQ